jgi:hypothetical protein
MNRSLPLCCIALLTSAFVPWPLRSSTPEPAFHHGICDASAAVSLNDDLFVVGDDEDNALRVYVREQDGPPLYSLDVSAFLGLRRKAEVDIEASARQRDRIYWLSSHGTNVRGKKRHSRQRFFATTGAVREGGIDLRPIGRPYSNLLQDLLRDPRLAALGLPAAANRPPKTPDALNIEGLTAAPEGHLLIGFRNPIPHGRALLVPLLNPDEIIAGRGPARLGAPILLDLDGLGIRSIDQWFGTYLILAGTRDGSGESWLYSWDGISKPRRITELRFSGINPEGLSVFGPEDSPQLLVLSDDGATKLGGTECKRLKDSAQKRFRSIILPLELEP